MTPKQTSTSTTKTYKDYMELIETVTRVEYSRLTANYLVDFGELLNIGIVTVHTLLNDDSKAELNITYLSTAIKWSIRNELRRRYKWYSQRSSENKNDDEAQTPQDQIREAIYETILSIDELSECDNPTQIKDSAATPDQNAELGELTLAVKAAIKKLPARQRELIEARFYKNKKLKTISDEFNISQSRISRVIQVALNKIKTELQAKELV